ncbi:hypothetical protein C1J01_02040 [Nonomuraea aridisoli]|uniref:Tyr recombinase domain-containing protein n=1 Tax=Nonomuraea aridisoli TaxID=2070368 RepID=A0A2W2F1J5_9ACTN|nr:hypothetical protein C1J01_02040 [Nonomuraea aridisoli]
MVDRPPSTFGDRPRGGDRECCICWAARQSWPERSVSTAGPAYGARPGVPPPSGTGPKDARVHGARHTAATLLIEQGVDISVVQEILGHSQLTTTKRYTHNTASLSTEAATRMGRAFWG